MDHRRFDTLTQSLATAKTRRGVLAGLGALLFGWRGASAQSDCPIPGQTRNRKGECNCPAGRRDVCPGIGCTSRRTDPSNCGSCGNVCFPIEACQKGECRCTCGPGFECFFNVCSPSEPTGMTLNGPVAKVWQALTDGETLTSLGISSNIAPKVGHRFFLRAGAGADGEGMIEAEMVAVDAPRQFAFKWLNGPLDEPTTVTVTLDPEADGAATRYRLTHTDASGATCQQGALVLGRNWGLKLFKESMPRYLA